MCSLLNVGDVEVMRYAQDTKSAQRLTLESIGETTLFRSRQSCVQEISKGVLCTTVNHEAMKHIKIL
jgi:hypothetical protein